MLRAYAKKDEMSLSSGEQKLRASMTGSTGAAGIDRTIAALVQDEVLARIASVLGA